jgi:predicted ribosome quality control (RQC) complex YloA/Tae2 family protein
MQDGELLKAAQVRIKRGAESIKLTDYFSAEPIEREIKLDPKLSPGENAAKYFNRYKKLIRSVDGIEEERSRQGEKIAQIRALLARLEEKTETPESIEAEALKAGLLEQRQESDTRKRKSHAPRLPYKSFTSCRGSEIRVGRTAKDNDQLTFRHANGKDLWLHTADAPGSHVVLRRQGNKEPDDEEVIDAATLAVHFSPLKAVSRADVHTAHVKEIKKPRGAKAGLVTLSGGKTLHIRMQPERLKRLLDREARRHKQ